jgi:hypothetical protein
MKSIILFGLLVCFEVNLTIAQKQTWLLNIPDNPRRIEIIQISRITTLPLYYCKTKKKVYAGNTSLEYDSIKITWGNYYFEGKDSLKILDYFDNYKFDNIGLFDCQDFILNPDVAIYFRLKRKWFKPFVYRIKEKKEIKRDWW